MIEKQFSIDGVMRTFLCYTKCPDYAGIEMQEIVNSSLDKANELIDFAYTSYSKANPSLIRPNLYVYIRKDMLKEINAFTDG